MKVRMLLCWVHHVVQREAAFAEARRRDVPVMISVDYERPP
jgi:uncharacterized protein YyaL (SSP411 family)